MAGANSKSHLGVVSKVQRCHAVQTLVSQLVTLWNTQPMKVPMQWGDVVSLKSPGGWRH